MHGHADIADPDADTDHELRYEDRLSRWAVMDHACQRQRAGQDHGTEDRGPKQADPFATLPANQRRKGHDCHFMQWQFSRRGANGVINSYPKSQRQD